MGLCISIINDINFIKYDILPKLLLQPTYRKGKYQALEVILPYIGAHTLLSSSNLKLLYSLVNNIGNKENLHITNVMAELWKIILIRHREEEGYIIIPSLKKTTSSKKHTIMQQEEEEEWIIPKEWILK